MNRITITLALAILIALGQIDPIPGCRPDGGEPCYRVYLPIIVSS